MPRIPRVGVTKAYLDSGAVDKLEEAAHNLRDCLLIRLLSRLGCRVSEVLALTVDDIDLQQGTVVIQHLKSRLNYKSASLELT